MLEDDLLVGPGFYSYACAVSARFWGTPEIAGFSLYAYQQNEESGLPFQIVSEGFDNYFMKVPSSWGQIWTAVQWGAFRAWLNCGHELKATDYMPSEVIAWPDSSWKKLYWKYLAASEKFLVHPASSHTTNGGDVGVHHETPTNRFQSILTTQSDKFRFAELSETVNVYDHFYELLPEKVSALETIASDLEIDVNGTKPLGAIAKKYLLSSRKCTDPISRFPLHVFPITLNFLKPNIVDSGNGYLSLGRTIDFEDSINPDVLEFYVSAVPKAVAGALREQGRRSLSKSDEFVIGARWTKILDRFPSMLKGLLRNTPLFRNSWKKVE
jgi:hypothetical protein